MIAHVPIQSAAFRESVQLLMDLHELMKGGKVESIDADRIREAMEQPWYAMSEDEQRLVRGISADLYEIDEPPIENAAKEEAIVGPILSALKNDRWVEALKLVREHQSRLPSAVASFWRGLGYAGLGLYGVSSEFFAHAVKLHSQEPLFWTLWMDSLMSSGRVTEALCVAEQSLERFSTPEVL